MSEKDPPHSIILSPNLLKFPCCQGCLHRTINNANKIKVFYLQKSEMSKDNVKWHFHIYVLLTLFSLTGSIYPLKSQCTHLRKMRL